MNNETVSEAGQVGSLLSDRRLATWEVISVTSSALMAEWLFLAAAGLSKTVVAVPMLLAFILMVSSHLLRRETLRDLGLRLDNFFQALKLLLLPMIAFAVVSIVAGRMLGGRLDFFRWQADRQLILGLGWRFAQQYVLQAFINRRAQIIFGRGIGSVCLTAAIFSLLHLPNPWLMLLTFVGGVIWSAVYQRAPNLFALTISHVVMTWLLVSTVPEAALNHLRIGLRYFG